MLHTLKKALVLAAILALCVFFGTSKVNTVKFVDQIPVWHKTVAVLHLYATDAAERASLVPAGSLETAIEYEELYLKHKDD